MDLANLVWLAAESLDDQRVHAVEQHDVGLGGEVPEERALGDPGLLDDLGYGGRVVALLVEQAEGVSLDLRPGMRLLALAQSKNWSISGLCQSRPPCPWWLVSAVTGRWSSAGTAWPARLPPGRSQRTRGTPHAYLARRRPGPMRAVGANGAAARPPRHRRCSGGPQRP